MIFKDPPPEFLPAVSSDEFLPPISRWMTWGGFALVGTFFGGVGLAAFTSYPVTVKAPAVVRPSGELRVVQAATEGLVIRIEVKENQVVRAGQVLAEIDDSRLQTQKSQLQSNIEQNQQQLVQIQAQLNALQNQIAAETERISRALTSAQAEFGQSQRNYQDRQTTTSAQVAEAEANLQQVFKELQKAQADLKSSSANLKSTEAAFKAAEARRDRYQPLIESGAIPTDLFEETQLAVDQQQQALESQKALVEAQQQEIERQQQAVEAAKARLLAAKASLNPSGAEVTVAQERIAQEQASGESSLARLNQEREQLIQRQVEVQNQLNRDTQQLQQTEKELKDTALKAPVAGIIQQLNLRNIAQVVRPGDVVAEIAPSQAPLVVKAMVGTGEISKVKADQPAQMRVSACPYPDYGTLKGTVQSVSPDARNPRDNAGVNSAGASSANVSQSGGVYEVTIEPEKFQLTAGSRQCAIVAGMEGSVDIIAKNETVLTFILRKARLLTDL
jgi:multidrug efflux pump subunit AcrA (membrane-fusion protein)